MQKIKRSKVNFSIKSSFQIKMFLKIAAIVFLGIIITSGVFYYYANQEVGDSFKHIHIKARSFLDYLGPVVIISIILGMTAAFAVALFFPHSIAGPLYRFEKDIKEKIGEGDLTVRFNLRKGDELYELAECMNIMLENLSLKIRGIESANNELLQFLSKNGDFPVKEIKMVQENLSGAIQKLKTHK